MRLPFFQIQLLLLFIYLWNSYLLIGFALMLPASRHGGVAGYKSETPSQFFSHDTKLRSFNITATTWTNTTEPTWLVQQVRVYDTFTQYTKKYRTPCLLIDNKKRGKEAQDMQEQWNKFLSTTSHRQQPTKFSVVHTLLSSFLLFPVELRYVRHKMCLHAQPG